MTISGFVAYVKQLWKNKPDTSTPLSAARLTHMEDGIKGNSDAIAKIAAAVVNQIANDPDKIASMAALYAVKQQVDQQNSDIAAANSRITPANVRLHTSPLYMDIKDSYYKTVKLSDIGLEGKKLPTYPLLLGMIITGTDNTLAIARLRRDNDDGFTIIFNKTFTAALTVSLLVSVND